ncbi:S-adenosyl-methyltransferase MraW [Tolypothrix sp. NIES-4075]|nr:S-adenosyl-methyltransferase MraW [Tolypothrix sp. NIES-4075]
MDRGQSLTAADVINDWDETELANIFFTYGEERLSRRIARRIVEKRPF